MRPIAEQTDKVCFGCGNHVPPDQIQDWLNYDSVENIKFNECPAHADNMYTDWGPNWEQRIS